MNIISRILPLYGRISSFHGLVMTRLPVGLAPTGAAAVGGVLPPARCACHAKSENAPALRFSLFVVYI